MTVATTDDDPGGVFVNTSDFLETTNTVRLIPIDNESSTTDSANPTDTVRLIPIDDSTTSDDFGGALTSIMDEIGSRTMTDSGITRTIPNHSRVTITRHTVVVTNEAPKSTPSSTVVTSILRGPPGHSSSRSKGSTPPVKTSPAKSSSEPSTSGSTGTIIGASVGGAVLLTILVIIVAVCIRRRRRSDIGRSASDATTMSAKPSMFGEKNTQPVSPRTTCTKNSSDPFAPFGGRVDQPHDPMRPASGTFEMDATSNVPIELPAISAGTYSRPSPSLASNNTGLQQPSSQQPTDPRANLNASLADRRENTYVNHWNQYRNLGHDGIQ